MARAAPATSVAQTTLDELAAWAATVQPNALPGADPRLVSIGEGVAGVLEELLRLRAWLAQDPDPYRIRDCLLVVGRQLRLALAQLALREIRGNPCWCVVAPEPAASAQEVEFHEARCEAATNAWIRAGHAGITL